MLRCQRRIVDWGLHVRRHARCRTHLLHLKHHSSAYNDRRDIGGLINPSDIAHTGRKKEGRSRSSPSP